MKTELKSRELSLKHVYILGVRISSTSRERLLSQIQEKISRKRQFYIVTPNPEIVLQAQNDPELLNILNESDFSIPDGFGFKLFGFVKEVIKGRELMVDLLKVAQERRLKIYLVGATEEVNKMAVAKIKSEYTNIEVEGGTSLHSDMVGEINRFSPDLVFVALGAPKQEKWAYKNLKFSWMAVGGSLDYYVGVVKPVPPIFVELGIEWLWRLIQEPKRIKRIFNAVIVFPLKVVLQGSR